MLGEELLTVERGSGGAYDVNGRRVAGTVESFVGTPMAVQPITGNELLMLAEGDREKQPLVLFTTFAIQLRDVVIRSGNSYKVMKVEDWDYPDSSVAHYKATALRVE